MNTVCECAIEKLFLKLFSSLNFNEKVSIIEVGRPTPNLPFSMIKSKNYIQGFKYEYCNTFNTNSNRVVKKQINYIDSLVLFFLMKKMFELNTVSTISIIFII